MSPLADSVAAWPALRLAPITVKLPLPVPASPLALMLRLPPLASWLPWARLCLLVRLLWVVLTSMLLLRERALIGALGVVAWPKPAWINDRQVICLKRQARCGWWRGTSGTKVAALGCGITVPGLRPPSRVNPGYACWADYYAQTILDKAIRVGSKLNCPVYVARHLSGFLIEFYMGFSCLRVGGGGG